MAGQLFANDGDATRLNLGEAGIAILTGSAGGAAQAGIAARYGFGFGYGIGGAGTGGLRGLGAVGAINIAGEGVKPLVGAEPGLNSTSGGTMVGYATSSMARTQTTLGVWIGAGMQEVATRTLTEIVDKKESEESIEEDEEEQENKNRKERK